MRRTARRYRPITRFGKNEEGQALIFVALGLILLMLMAGWGVDVGTLRYKKQQMQRAADAGAIAGASALIYNGNIIAAGKADAAANGYTDGSNGVTVAVNNPPQSGPHTGDNNYVEVIVSQDQRTYFFSGGRLGSPVPVRGRSVASAATSASGCVYVLDPSDADTFQTSGNATFQAECGIYVASNNPAAFKVVGNACVSAENRIGVVGGIDKINGCTSPTPQTGIAPFVDPLSGVPAPAVGNCQHGPQVWNITSSMTIPSGTYCGISISGGPGTVVTMAGTYVMAGGGFSISGQATVNGAGVTIYNTTGPVAYAPITITGGSQVTLSAPTSGAQEGMLFFQDRNLPAGDLSEVNNIAGGSSNSFTGALYFPTTPLQYAGGSNEPGSAYTIIVAYTLKVTGDSVMNDNYSSLGTGNSPIKTPTLIE